MNLVELRSVGDVPDGAPYVHVRPAGAGAYLVAVCVGGPDRLIGPFPTVKVAKDAGAAAAARRGVGTLHVVTAMPEGPRGEERPADVIG